MAPRGSGRSQELQLLRAIGANYGRLRSFSALSLACTRQPLCQGCEGRIQPLLGPHTTFRLQTSAHKRPGGTQTQDTGLLCSLLFAFAIRILRTARIHAAAAPGATMA